MGWRELGADYRNSLWQLAQYERREAYLRAAAGTVTFLAISALPLAVLVASVYVAALIVPQLAFEQAAEKTRETLRDAGIRARIVGVDVP